MYLIKPYVSLTLSNIHVILLKQTQLLQLFGHMYQRWEILLSCSTRLDMCMCGSWCIRQAWSSCNVMLTFKTQTMRPSVCQSNPKTSSLQPNRQHSFMPNLKELTHRSSPAPFSLASPVIFSVITSQYSYVSVICSLMHVITKTKSQALVRGNVCAYIQTDL